MVKARLDIPNNSVVHYYRHRNVARGRVNVNPNARQFFTTLPKLAQIQVSNIININILLKTFRGKPNCKTYIISHSYVQNVHIKTLYNVAMIPFCKQALLQQLEESLWQLIPFILSNQEVKGFSLAITQYLGTSLSMSFCFSLGHSFINYFAPVDSLSFSIF